MAAAWRQVGVVGAAHGLKGDVRVKPLGLTPEQLLTVTRFYRQPEGEALEFIQGRVAKDAVILRFKGIEDRDAAQSLTNSPLYVPVTALKSLGLEGAGPAAEELIGFEVMDAKGRKLGRVVGVADYGAGALLEIESPDKDGKQLLPLQKSVVVNVDTARSEIEVDADFLV